MGREELFRVEVDEKLAALKGALSEREIRIRNVLARQSAHRYLERRQYGESLGCSNR